MPRNRPFVKSRDTGVPVQQSMEDLKALVRKHGASGFGIREDYVTGESTVEFVLVKDDARVPIRIPVSRQRVFDAMYATDSNRYKNDADMKAKRLEQCERVAWRQVFVIVDALLTAVQVGIMDLTDAFLGSMVVVDEATGQTSRMAELMAGLGGALPGGRRLLLPSKTGGPT